MSEQKDFLALAQQCIEHHVKALQEACDGLDQPDSPAELRRICEIIEQLQTSDC